MRSQPLHTPTSLKGPAHHLPAAFDLSTADAAVGFELRGWLRASVQSGNSKGGIHFVSSTLRPLQTKQSN